MDTETSVEGLIQKAYDKLDDSDADAAREILEKALGLDFDHPEVKYGLKCLGWWLEHIRRIDDLGDPYDKGGFILSQWKPYYGFLDRFEDHYDSCQYAIRHYVYSVALNFFADVLGDGVNEHDPDLLLLVGRCYKGVGNYEEALKYLEQARQFKREDGETFAELADVNALLGETKLAKAQFREAFFIDPQKVNLRAMESEMIIRLRDRVKEMGGSGPELAEWLPIYGRLFKVFSVIRGLKRAEVTKLKQSIFELENEIRGGDRASLLKPRLLNRYFWLIEHYENTGEDQKIIEETFLKIKILDKTIYEWYIQVR
jgi:tetratricopeptide (TPR) repeat protein